MIFDAILTMNLLWGKTILESVPSELQMRK